MAVPILFYSGKIIAVTRKLFLTTITINLQTYLGKHFQFALRTNEKQGQEKDSR